MLRCQIAWCVWVHNESAPKIILLQIVRGPLTVRRPNSHYTILTFVVLSIWRIGRINHFIRQIRIDRKARRGSKPSWRLVVGNWGERGGGVELTNDCCTLCRGLNMLFELFLCGCWDSSNSFRMCLVWTICNLVSVLVEICYL